jgi:HEAT repeat protein
MTFILTLFLLLASPQRSDAEVAAQVRDVWKQTLLYGIDSQVLQTVQEIREMKDTSLTSELARLLATSASGDVQKAILDLFSDQKAKEGEETARRIIGGWQDQKSELVISAIHYLMAAGAAGITKDLIPLIDVADNGIASQAIEALGASQDRSVTEILLSKLISADFPDGRKSQVILALGALKDPAAEDQLIAVVKDTEQEKTWRLYAADALGKIGDAKAIPILKSLMAENDALSKTYAASALARFDVSLVIDQLLAGMRDDSWKVRTECIKALARPLPGDRTSEVISILSYKAKSDPVSQVRVEAISTLAVIGGDDATSLMLDLFTKTGTPPESREKALSLLVEKNPSDSTISAIAEAVNADTRARDQKALLWEARVLSSARAPGLKEIFERFLENADPYVRLYAIKGIELNAFSALKEKLLRMAEKDPLPGIKKEAARVADKL